MTTWQCFVDTLAAFVYSTITMAHTLDHKQKVIRRPGEPRRRKGGVSLGTSLGLPALGIGALIEEIQTGLPFKVLVSFSSESGISISETASVIEVSERTLARRRLAGRFSPEESERLLRLSNVFERALGFFEGDVKAAVAWLRSPNRALGHKTPFTYARTEIGARQVEDLIGRLEHGVFV
jgi:putative toxin-antitoxin system antitoxin component (TIGR02293 family)